MKSIEIKYFSGTPDKECAVCHKIIDNNYAVHIIGNEIYFHPECTPKVYIPLECDKCEGTGDYYDDSMVINDANMQFPGNKPCTVCNGTGFNIDALNAAKASDFVFTSQCGECFDSGYDLKALAEKKGNAKYTYSHDGANRINFELPTCTNCLANSRRANSLVYKLVNDIMTRALVSFDRGRVQSMLAEDLDKANQLVVHDLSKSLCGILGLTYQEPTEE